MIWRANPGKQPSGTEGKRVAVELANGMVCGLVPYGNSLPVGWAADRCCWKIEGHPFDIARFAIIV